MRGAFIWRLPPGRDCALTFDDGPHEVYTPRILDLLARQGIKASFFVVGESAARYPSLVRRIVEEGHGIASHTYSHRDMPVLTRTELRDEVVGCRKIIRDLAGVDTVLVRPPRGRIDVASLVLLRRWGYCVVHWSKTYSDYLRDGTSSLLRRMRSAGLDARDIVLLHDNNAHTLEALSDMLPEWMSLGRTFVRLRQKGEGA